MENNQFSKSLIGGVIVHVLYNYFVYYLFVLPIHIWMNAVVRLHNQKTQGRLSLKNSKSRWPLLSFLKSFILEFMIDASIFLTPLLGALYLIVYLIGVIYTFTQLSSYDYPGYDYYGLSFGAILLGILGILLYVLWLPIAIKLYGELLRILILPIKKFILWCEKPPQHLDIEMRNR